MCALVCAKLGHLLALSRRGVQHTEVVDPTCTGLAAKPLCLGGCWSCLEPKISTPKDEAKRLKLFIALFFAGIFMGIYNYWRSDRNQTVFVNGKLYTDCFFCWFAALLQQLWLAFSFDLTAAYLQSYSIIKGKCFGNCLLRFLSYQTSRTRELHNLFITSGPFPLIQPYAAIK